MMYAPSPTPWLLALSAGLLFTACRPAAPALRLQPEALDFGEVLPGDRLLREVTVTNDGAATLRIELALLPGGTHSDRATWFSADAGVLLVPAGERRTVGFVFAPAGSGEADAVAVLATNAAPPIDLVKVVLRGSGRAAGDVIVSPDALDFGLVSLGGAESELRLENRGGAAARVSVHSPVGEGAPAFVVQPESLFLEPGAHHLVHVAFLPIDAADHQARLPIEIDGRTLSVPLSGVGGAPVLQVGPERLDFGVSRIGAVVQQTLTLRNEGTLPVEVTPTLADLEGGDASSAFALEGAGVTHRLTPGTTLELAVRYAPRTLGAHQAVIRWESSDPARPEGSIPLMGVAAGPDLRVAPNPLDFGWIGLQGDEGRRHLRLQNLGSVPLNLLGVTSEGEGFLASLVGGSVVPEGGSTDVLVRFRPTRPGAHTGVVHVLSDDADQPDLSVQVLGEAVEGVGCRARVAPEPLDFGLAGAGERRVLTVTVLAEPDGSAPCLVAVDDVQGGEGAFTLPGGPVARQILDPGQRLEVPVAFVGDAPGGAFGAELPVWAAPADRPVSLVAGTFADAPGVFLAPGALDFGQIVPRCRGTREVCLWNTGPPRTLTGAEVVGPDLPPVFEVSPPPGGLLGTGSGACFPVRFSPLNESSYAAGLHLLSDEPHWPGDLVVPLRGRGALPGLGHQVVPQGPLARVDLLVVVDPADLGPELDALAGSFPGLLQVVAQGATDYRLAVVAAEAGGDGVFLRASGRPAVITPALPDPAAAFRENVLAAGAGGTAPGEPLHAAWLALQPERLSDPQTNAGFLRPDATLSILVVTAKDDASPWPTALYRDALFALKGGARNRVSLSAVAPPTDGCSGPCASAGPGGRLAEVVAETGGLLDSVCACRAPEDWRALYRRALGHRDTFLLDGHPREPWFGPDGRLGTSDDFLVVRVRGLDNALRPAQGWIWDPARNAVVFEAGLAPRLGEKAEVSWTPACGYP